MLDIKIKLLEKNMTMSKLAETLDISRELLYYKIKKNHNETIKQIKSILS